MMAETLANMNIWLIDNDIPLDQATFEHGDMLQGIRPIDRGSLLTLLTVKWEDEAVKALCEELILKAGNVIAFLQPAAALGFLNAGAAIPDAIIFDLKYGGMSRDIMISHLEGLLQNCITIVQVYTNESLDEANRDLEPCLDKFPKRLMPPKNKVATSADKLAEVLDERIQNSLSARLAIQIRRLSLMAVENVLVKLDNLPISVAIRLLTENEANPEELEVQLIDMLSVKVAEQLESAPELAALFDQYAKGINAPKQRRAKAVEEMVALLVSNLRGYIRYDSGLFETIQSAFNQPENDRAQQETSSIVQEFFAFRLYDHPKDDLVRTGDIVVISHEGREPQDPDDLYLVITPPCDLARFWKKTRGSMTLAKLYPNEALPQTDER